MQITWSILLPAVVLLFYPIDRLLPAYMKCRTSDALTDPAAKHRRGWWRWQPELWADVVRVAVATWCVALAFTPEAAKARWIETLVVGALLAVGVCCQMPTRREDEAVLAPLTFLLGAMLALLPVTAAIAVFVLAMAAMLAFRSYVAFFLTGALLVTGLTYLLGGDVLMGLVVAAVHIIALMASFLIGGELVLPVRNRVEPKKISVPVR